MTLADRLRSALDRPPAEPLLAGDDASETAVPTPAAVLIAVTDRPQPGVILTVRHADLRTHPGQVAFPGGRIDAGEDATAAALREAWEELGLEPDAVEIVAPFARYRTITGYEVTPVIGVVPPDLPLAPHEPEVADWFEAPLGFLLDPAAETAWVYRPDAEPTEVTGFDQTLSGDDVLPGFVLELRRLRR